MRKNKYLYVLKQNNILFEVQILSFMKLVLNYSNLEYFEDI